MTQPTHDSDTPEIQDTIRHLDRLAAADRQTPEGFEDRLLDVVLEAHRDSKTQAAEGRLTHTPNENVARTLPNHRRGRAVFAFTGGLSAIAAVLLVGFLLRPEVSPVQSENMLALSDDDDAWLLAEVMDAIESADTQSDTLDELANELKLLNESESEDTDVLDFLFDTSDGGVL